ncbi:MAG TPA: FAD-binding oxidoreductase, partial [Burkholderiaceae bacterium]|nr:FAD-binding oxidoreductase [Burkholderiaceae bacterium]
HNYTMIAEAGCVLADVQAAATAADRLFPLSLGSEGSCQLGGNLSTNAGGTAVLRYGMMRDLVLGLEVVLPDGRVLDGLSSLRKDNTGYDLRDLFIGAEGTLGVITAATMKLYPQPAGRVIALAAVASPDDALRLLERAQARLAASLTAFELISRFCLELVAVRFPDAARPFAVLPPYCVLIESSDAESEAHAQQLFESLMTEAIDHALVADCAIAASLAQSAAFWPLRENISEAQVAQGPNVKHDIAVPTSAIGRFVAATNAAIERAFPGARMVVFGHLGDGNLHYNVAPPPGEPPARFMTNEAAINRLVYDAVAGCGGSISAEHGIGALKVDENRHYKSAVELALMTRIKRALDPLGLMNPGRVLP